MIDIEALEKICLECNGYGQIENPNWSKYWARNEKLKDWFWRLDLEEQLGISKRMLPEQPAEPIFFKCKHCHGRGRVLTEEGEKLIEFVRSWINPNY